MRKLKISLSVFTTLTILLSCTSSQDDALPDEYLRGSFKSQIMTFHPEHKYFLTNTDDSGTLPYDLRKKEMRETFDKLHFVCTLGEKRYFICQDSIGLCRRTNKCIKRKWHIFKKYRKCLKYEVETMGLEKHNFLVKSGIHCYSEFVYPKGIYY